MNATAPSPSATHHVAQAHNVFDIEIAALKATQLKLGSDFEQACELCLQCQGRIVVTGMGKSGHIGSKIAATLASTGSPAFFVHPGEAGHGDMGMIKPTDVVLAISHSGETDEINHLIPIIRKLKAKLIGISGTAHSTLAKAADVHLATHVEKEACPHNLAPTASTTATLALGDALAVSLLSARGFSANDFARSHPSGRLGKRLLLTVQDLMHTGADIPLVQSQSTLSQTLLEITDKKLGMSLITDATGQAIGLFTDGDLRRALDQGVDIHTRCIDDIMTTDFHHIGANALAVDALVLMEKYKINALAVLDAKRQVLGALNIHTLLSAGVA